MTEPQRQPGWFSRWRRSQPIEEPTPTPEVQTAFVLAGGGNRGAVQVGMLSELTQRGIRPDHIYGASVGSINALSFASNPTRDGIDSLAEMWLGLTGNDIFPASLGHGPWRFLQRTESMHSNLGLRRLLGEGLTFERLEDSPIPLHVVTTSLAHACEQWFDQGPAIDIVLASSAIPGIFPPVELDGELYIDGGVVNNVPISRAIADGNTKIYVLLCEPEVYEPSRPRRPVEAALTAFFIAVHSRMVRDLAAVPEGIEVVVFSGERERSSDYRDFTLSRELMDFGRHEVARVLDGHLDLPEYHLERVVPAPESPPTHPHSDDAAETATTTA